MKYFMYKAIRDNESNERSYWQVWVHDSREKGGLRLVEPQHHTKRRAHALADLFNHELREFIAYNDEDVTQKKKPAPELTQEQIPVPAVKYPSVWERVVLFFSALFGRSNKDT